MTDSLRRVLLIAYHFPPVRGSSGVQRTLNNVRHLPEFGWDPAVLTANPRAYVRSGPDQLGDIPPATCVRRSFALDAARHLSVRGAYPGFFAIPDRWSNWWLSAVPVGLNMIRSLSPSAIWSTYPIATAHMIGITLAKLSGIPWVADFRDSMTEADYPRNPRVRKVYQWIERAAVRRAARSVFTTPGTLAMYRERYPEIRGDRFICMPNGYSEEDFSVAADRLSPGSDSKGRRRITLIHSGLLYPLERDPRQFFGALADLKGGGQISARTLEVKLRATGHDDLHRQLLAEFGITDLVSLEPGIAYVDALAEMLRADGLLLFQGADCNHQIPAKLYEYLRAGRPILALTDSAGDTARTLRQSGVDTIVPLDDREQIRNGLMNFLAKVETGHAPVATKDVVQSFSRRSQTERLAGMLDEISTN